MDLLFCVSFKIFICNQNVGLITLAWISYDFVPFQIIGITCRKTPSNVIISPQIVSQYLLSLSTFNQVLQMHGGVAISQIIAFAICISFDKSNCLLITHMDDALRISGILNAKYVILPPSNIIAVISDDAVINIMWPTFSSLLTMHDISKFFQFHGDHPH